MKIAALIIVMSAVRVRAGVAFLRRRPRETHYSKLAAIHRGNAQNLKPVWEWKTGEAALPEYKTTPGAFEATPLMIGGCAVREHAVQQSSGARCRDGNRSLVVRPQGVRRRASAQRHGLRASRSGGLARRQKRQAAHLHEQPCAIDLTRRGERQAGGRLRRQRRGQSGERTALGDRPEAIHQHLAARGVQGPRDRRQRCGRSSGV